MVEHAWRKDGLLTTMVGVGSWSKVVGGVVKVVWKMQKSMAPPPLSDTCVKIEGDNLTPL